MLNITAENITSVISDYLIQFLIGPSSTNAKLEQTYKLQRCYKNFDAIINKLLDKHAPYVMSKSRSSFATKPWITTPIANSIKSKNKIYKKSCKEKKNPQQKEIYGKQFKTYRNHLTSLLRIAKDEYYKTHSKENKKNLKTVWKTIKKL